jgi:formate-dependent nitrite reductase membrane component NrfD
MNNESVTSAEVELHKRSNSIILGASLLVLGMVFFVASYHPAPKPTALSMTVDQAFWVCSIGLLVLGIERLIVGAIDYAHFKFSQKT